MCSIEQSLKLLKHYNIMRFFRKFSTLVLVVVASFIFFSPKLVRADADRCYCYSDISQINTNADLENTNFLNVCERVLNGVDCGGAALARQKALNPSASNILCDDIKYDSDTCNAKLEAWKVQKNRLDISKQSYDGAHSSVVGKFIPACLLEDTLSADCRDVSIFFTLLFNVTNYLFSIIGAIALLMFIYGGFVMILSQGQSEKIEQGKNAMVAAIIGLAIAFGGYMIVKYLGEAVQLKSQFRLQ